jgi:translocation and assembly module TamA
MLAVAGACAHAPPHRPGDERLAAVDFEGNKRIDDGDLLNGLGLHRVLKRGGSPDPYTMELDADRIRGEYLRKGFLDIGVTSRVERKGDDTKVIYTIEEGPQARVRTVITGLPPGVPVAKVREQLPLNDGGSFDYETYDLAKPRLLGVVQDAGYAHAKLEASVIADRATSTAIVNLAYEPGPKCTFGPVKITGVSGELAEAARERITFSPGQPYSTQAVVQTQRNLYGFGRFSTVRVTPDTGTDSNVVGVEVAVAQGTRHEIQLGGGFGIDSLGTEVRGRAGYTIAGWPFPLDTSSIDLRPAYARLNDGTYEPRIRALAKLERKDLFWTYTKASVEAGYNYLTVEAYTSYGPLARLGFETPLGTDRVTLRVGWGIEYVSFRRPNDEIMAEGLEPELRITKPDRVAGFQQKLVVDLRDHPIEPRLGGYLELATTEGTKYAGGSDEYFAVVPDLRGYVPLLGRAVLAAHARFGGIFGDVPATERFFAGGAISQRGFADRRLSPQTVNPDAKGDRVPYGGAGLIDSSIEARVPVTTVKNMPLGFATFLDGGDVTKAPADLDLWNLHWAVGAGLRLMTIIGPVRLDVAYRLTRTGTGQPDPDSHYAYHLTIGEAF